MKKVVIVSTAFFETSLPLAKHMTQFADVSFYALFSSNFICPSNFDISGLNVEHNNILSFSNADKEKKHYLVKYLGDLINRTFITVLGNKIIKNILAVRHLAKTIKNQNPDVVHLIGFNLYYLLFFFSGLHKKLFISLHEIGFGRINKRKIIPGKDQINSYIMQLMIKTAIFRKAGFIFHSENVAGAFFDLYKYNHYKVIPFGNFEIFPYTGKGNFQIDSPYFLFFGYVRDYKGADIFVKAANLISEKHTNHKFVIAGKDANRLSQLVKNKNIILIDEFLNDADLAGLINSCMAVVAPHRQASQSGLPNTAFCFNKPVIASNIPGLREYILEGVNGMLFESENFEELANHLSELCSDSSLLQKFADNIAGGKLFPELSWNKIAKTTFENYNL
jgi:glycosyltransferase involved in cell wall biosynthesis